MSRLVAIGHETDALVRKRAPLNDRWFALCDADDKDDPRHDEETTVVSSAEGVIDENLDELFDEAVKIPAVTVADLRGKAALLRHEFLMMNTDRYTADTAHEPSVIMALGICDDIERLAEADAELVALCDRLAVVEKEALRVGNGLENPSDEAMAEAVGPFWDERAQLLDRLGTLRATTGDGIAARARALDASNPTDAIGPRGYTFDETDTIVGRQLEWLLRDATAMGFCVGSARNPDAELIALGRDYAAKEVVQWTLEAVLPATDASCERSDRINEQFPVLIERALASTACTPDGISAKLAILRSAAPYALRGLDKVTEEQTRLAWTLVRDLLAMIPAAGGGA